MIDAPEVRLIDEDGSQIGIVSSSQALKAAQEKELDLVEISPTANPPVCRIMDFGKFKYQQQKREHEQRRKSHGLEVKQIRIKTFSIDPHDLQIKLEKARQFLEEGHRLIFSLMFRAREHAHADLGRELLEQKVAKELADISKIDAPPRKEGRRMTMTLSPLPNIKRIVQEKRKAEEAERHREERERRENHDQADRESDGAES